MREHDHDCGEDLEDVPMSRYGSPVPACECGEEQSDCPCGGQLREILAALEWQNQLLVDILGAINGLTAAWLSRHA